MLNNKSIVEELKKEITTYQNENVNGEVNPTILWGALKAVMSGKLIAKTASTKKAKEEAYENEKENLLEIEQHKNTRDPHITTKN